MRPDRPPGARKREGPQDTTPRGHSPKRSTDHDEARASVQAGTVNSPQCYWCHGPAESGVAG
jgi:hypothetical protein